MPRRSTPFRVERLADLVACSLSGALGRSLLKKGTRTFISLCHFSCLMFVCRFGRLYRGPALPAYPSCSDPATYVLGDTQASFLPYCSKLPSALPNCMHRRPFVGCALGLISFKRCERLLGKDLPRAFRRKEDESTALYRDGLRGGVRVISATKVPMPLNFLCRFLSHRVLRRRPVRACQNQVRRHRSSYAQDNSFLY